MMARMRAYFNDPQHTFFQYGVFTTLAMRNGGVEFWSDHRQRLLNNAISFFEMDEGPVKLLDQIEKKMSEHDIGNWRIKICIYPKNGESLSSNILPESLTFAIFTQQMTAPAEHVATKSLLDFNMTNPSQVKYENYGLVFEALRRVKRKNFDDILFVKNDGNYTRASTSNFFVIKNDRIMVPDFISLEQLMGITIRHVLTSLAPRYEIVTKNINYDLICQSDGLYLVNSIKGICPVDAIDNQKLASRKFIGPIEIIWSDYKREFFK